jgi:hypothetical protein
MARKNFIFAMLLVTMVFGVYTCTPALSGQTYSGKVTSNAKPSGSAEVKTDLTVNPFQAIPAETTSIINGVKIKYTRDDRGCIETCQFWNDPARCGPNAECCREMDGKVYEECVRSVKESKAGYTDCLPVPTPKISGETVVSAGNTTDNAQVCTEFRIVTHGSPGISTVCRDGNCTVSCLGYSYPPWCCQVNPATGGWSCIRF